METEIKISDELRAAIDLLLANGLRVFVGEIEVKR